MFLSAKDLSHPLSDFIKYDVPATKCNFVNTTYRSRSYSVSEKDYEENVCL